MWLQVASCIFTSKVCLLCRHAQRQKKIPSFGMTGPSGPCRTRWPYRLSIRRSQRISSSSWETVSRNERPELREIHFLKCCEVPLENRRQSRARSICTPCTPHRFMRFPPPPPPFKTCLSVYCSEMSGTMCQYPFAEEKKKQRAERELWGKNSHLNVFCNRHAHEAACIEMCQ